MISSKTGTLRYFVDFRDISTGDSVILLQLHKHGFSSRRYAHKRSELRRWLNPVTHAIGYLDGVGHLLNCRSLNLAWL